MNGAGTRHTFTGRQQGWLVGSAILVFFALTVWNLSHFVEQRTVQEIYRTGYARAVFSARSLQDSLEKYRHLPYVLARDARIRSLLKGEIDDIKVNPHLEDFANATGALIFVLDKGGSTVAASNWRTKQSLLGHNFNFRPYFLNAKNEKPGGYYGVGLQTRKPGFYISYPVFEVGRLLGVVVVKVNLASLQESWRKGNETIMVSDAYGVVILSSRSEWNYTTLQPLAPQTRKRLITNQYLETNLEELAIERKNTEQGNILHIAGTPYLEISRQLPDYGWRLHYLADIQRVDNLVRLTVLALVTFFVMLFLLLLYYRERKQKLISRQEAKEAEAIRKLNQRLKEEVAEHMRTEQSLRDTQKELLQAGKLAALGRMSAAVAHELNQPVTAIRTFLASCKIFIERGQIDNVAKNLALISSLTDRMASITGQMKTFSRKNRSRNEAVDLVERVERVLEFISPQLEEAGISVYTSMVEHGRAVTLGDPVRVEQVLNNVLKNSMDALKDSTERTIDIAVAVDGETGVAKIEDSGSGISGEALEYLYEPFFTTKDSGEGLGLGLSISYTIMQDMGGSIEAGNRPQGGACFELRFPLSSQNSNSEERKE